MRHKPPPVRLLRIPDKNGERKREEDDVDRRAFRDKPGHWRAAWRMHKSEVDHEHSRPEERPGGKEGEGVHWRSIPLRHRHTARSLRASRDKIRTHFRQERDSEIIVIYTDFYN